MAKEKTEAQKKLSRAAKEYSRYKKEHPSSHMKMGEFVKKWFKEHK